MEGRRDYLPSLFSSTKTSLSLCSKPQNHTHMKLLIPISWRVEVGPPECTPPPEAFASFDIIDEASDPLVIPEGEKPALRTFWSDISLSGGVESTEALRGSASSFMHCLAHSREMKLLPPSERIENETYPHPRNETELYENACLGISPSRCKGEI